MAANEQCFRKIKLTSHEEINDALVEINQQLSKLQCDLSNVYVTLCTPDYYFGLLALHNSLQKSGTQHQLIVMIDSEWGEMSQRNWVNTSFVKIPRIVEPRFDLSRSEFSVVLSKLWIFGCTAFGKAVFLDSDTLVLKNIDDLFERPSLSFAPDYVENAKSERFNSGVFVVEPRKKLFDRIIKAGKILTNYDGGDQGILNAELATDVSMLPIEYNVSRHFYNYSGIELRAEDVKVLHYIVKKPWELAYREAPDAILSPADDLWASYLEDSDLRSLVNKWRRDVFIKFERFRFDRVHDYESKRLARSVKRYSLRMTFLLLIAFICYPILLIAILG